MNLVSYANLQADALAYLSSIAPLYQVFLFASKPADIASDVAKALSGLKATNGASGAAIEIGKPFLAEIDPDSPGPTGFVELRFLVKTFPTINNGARGTKLIAEEISLLLIQSLLEWGAEGSQAGSFIPAANCDTPAFGAKEDPWEGRYVVMRAKFSATPLLRTVTPVLTGDTSAVTIAVAAPDAAAGIYYTLDGTCPGVAQGTPNPGGTSIVYTAPFPVASGTVVRSMAIAASKLPSIVNYSTVT